MKENKIYEKAYSGLSKCSVYPGMDMTFDEACRKSGISRMKTDNQLYESLGMSGEDIIKNIGNFIDFVTLFY